jgi:glycine hydroxymethyltransferase
MQGGPLMHVIAAKAVAFGEALRAGLQGLCRAGGQQRQGPGDALISGGLDIVSGGTDSHMVLVDLRPKGVTGKDTEQALERANMTCNKNSIPFDTGKAVHHHLGRAARHPGRHHARLRRGRVPPHRRVDRRCR